MGAEDELRAAMGKLWRQIEDNEAASEALDRPPYVCPNGHEIAAAWPIRCEFCEARVVYVPVTEEIRLREALLAIVAAAIEHGVNDQVAEAIAHAEVVARTRIDR